MTTLETIIENYSGSEIMIADGFDNAVIGFDDSKVRLKWGVNVEQLTKIC